MDGGGVWIESTRGPDDEPVCLVTVGPYQSYPSVDAVRETAMDMFTCAAYAELMLELVTGPAHIPPPAVEALMTSLLRGRQKRFFGAKDTLTMMPAVGRDKRRHRHGAAEAAALLKRQRREAMVLLKRGKWDGWLKPDETREMAARWMAVAEATQSDQLVTEALRTAGIPAPRLAAIFGYLHELRSDPGAPGFEGDQE